MVKSKSTAQPKFSPPPMPVSDAAVVSAATAVITPEQRERMIAEAAYYRAERRGFQGGDPGQDWLDAEVEIDRMLSETVH